MPASIARICILNKPYLWKWKYFAPQVAWVVPWGTTQLCRESAQVREKIIAPGQRIGKHILEFFDLADILTTLQLPCIILLSDSEHPGYCLWTFELPLQFFLPQVKEITFGQLRERVREVAAALKRWRPFDDYCPAKKKNNQHHHHHHPDYHHHHQGWRLCGRPCGRLHPQLPRGDHCHGGDCISRWIMKIIAAKIIVGILLIFRSRVEFNFAGLWGLWRSRPLLADWTKSKGGWRWYFMLMATLIFWGKKLK